MILIVLDCSPSDRPVVHKWGLGMEVIPNYLGTVLVGILKVLHAAVQINNQIYFCCP